MTSATPAHRSGFRIPYPDDPYEVGAGPFWVPDVAEPDGTLVLWTERKHCNGSGVVHGGLLATMADLAVCWLAVIGHSDERAVTVSLTTDYAGGAVEGDVLVARPEIVRRTGSLVFARCTLRAHEGGPDGAESRPVAVASAVIKRMRRTPRA
ncbi:MAG: PaaI family thioesterase [Alphaproteobacteria bacterium]